MLYKLKTTKKQRDKKTSYKYMKSVNKNKL